MKLGWQTSTLGEVLDVLRNGVNCQQDKSGNGDKISRIESISDASFDLEKVGYAELTERDKERYRLQSGDILFSHINSPIHVGKTAVFDSTEPVYHGVNLLLMRPKDVVSSAYLDHALKFLFQSGYWRSVCKQSVNQASVNQQDISRVEISYPKSLPEQQRIVGILDEAFDGIATAKANAEQNLQNARALFESHLQSVFTQRGDGWVEKRLGEVYDVRDGTHDSPKYHPTGFPLITSKNLKREGLSFDDVSLINEQDFAKINQRSVVHKGDVLFAMIGTIGNPTLVTVEPNFAIKNVALFKIPQGQSGAFLKYYLASGWVISKMMQEAKGTTQKFVGLGYLRDFPINVPPLAKQLEVVESLDELSVETQRLESLYQRKLAALDELKKSLLHQAFSGML